MQHQFVARLAVRTILLDLIIRTKNAVRDLDNLNYRWEKGASKRGRKDYSVPSCGSPHIPEHVQFIFVQGTNQCCGAGVGLAKNYFWGAGAVISCFGSTAPKPKKCFLCVFFQQTLYIFFFVYLYRTFYIVQFCSS